MKSRANLYGLSSAVVLVLTALSCNTVTHAATPTPPAAVEVSVATQPATSSYGGQQFVAFSDADHLFSAQVPADWQSSLNTNDPTTLKWAWTSPDQAGGIVFIEYNDGKQIPTSDLGKSAEDILNDFFKKTDTINITEQNPQPDGSLQISWGLAHSKTDGTTYIYKRGNTILVLSTLFDEASFDAFAPIFSYVASTYIVP